MPKRPGVYAIESRSTGKRYVGATRNLHLRRRSHSTSTQSRSVRRALDELGADDLMFVILEFVADDAAVRTNLAAREWYWQCEDAAAGRLINDTRQVYRDPGSSVRQDVVMDELRAFCLVHRLPISPHFGQALRNYMAAYADLVSSPPRPRKRKDTP